MFTQATVIIDRQVNDVYEFVANLSKQLECWEFIANPECKGGIAQGLECRGSITIGRKTSRCDIQLYLTRPGAGCVTRISWDTGELAAEWRFTQEGNRTKIELNLEGTGGGVANSGPLRQICGRILARVKQRIDVV